MSPRKSGRAQACGAREAATRMTQARKFLEVAELVASDLEEEGNASVAASLAVLAGIAASDAACCARLGRRSRSQDHHAAEALLAEILPQGRDAAKKLRRLLDLKDTANYGVIHISATDLRSALRQAAGLVKFANETVSTRDS